MYTLFKKKYTQTSVWVKCFFYIILGSIWSLSNVGYTAYTTGFPVWITFVPFLCFIYLEGYKSGFFYSLLFGTAAYTVHLWWMTNPAFDLVRLYQLPFYLTILVFFLVIVCCLLIWTFLGLSYSLFFLIVKYLSKKNVFYFAAAVPLVFTVIDYFYPKIWGDRIGYSQYVFLPISQAADILGVSWITFLILACNSALFVLLREVLSKKKRIAALMPIVTVLLLIGLTVIYGLFRLRAIDTRIGEAHKVSVGIVQGNISGFDKRNLGFKKILSIYNRLSGTLTADKPDLVIWPESSVVITIPGEMKSFSWLKKFDGAPLLFGTHYFEKEQSKLYNSLVLISDDNNKLGVYNKRKLVPLSEEIPITALNFVMKWYGFSYFSRGKKQPHLMYKKMKIAPNICYEAIFPDFIRRSLFAGGNQANIIINGTNDSWFGPRIEPVMHLVISGFRSIENRKTLVRATCTGYSAVVDPAGRVIYTSSLGGEEAASVEVPLMETRTLYNRGGWLFVYILAGILVLLMIVTAISRNTIKKIRQT